MDNKAFVNKCLQALEHHGKSFEIYQLTCPSFCQSQFGIQWADGNATCTVLKLVNYAQSREEQLGEVIDRYYPETVMLFGTKYYVYNNWFDQPNDQSRPCFFAWVKNVIFPELSDLESILETKKEEI